MKNSYVKHNTLKMYMQQAQHLFDEQGISHQLVLKFTEIIMKAHKKYESVPNRCHMITDSIMAWLIKKADKADTDSELRAIVDWIIIGRFTGYRSSEWHQNHMGMYARIPNWPGEPSLAQTRNDLTFLGEDERHIRNDHALTAKNVSHLTCE